MTFPLWLIGCVISLGGSIGAIFGTNVQKLSFRKNEALPPSQRRVYYRQTLWLCGLVLVGIGGVTDFISLGLTAQSIIASLGSFNLCVNVFLAHFWLGESIGLRDFIGTSLIIIGSTLSVVFGDHSSTSYTAGQLRDLYGSDEYIGYGSGILGVLIGMYLLCKLKLTPLRLKLVEAIDEYNTIQLEVQMAEAQAQIISASQSANQSMIASASGNASAHSSQLLSQQSHSSLHSHAHSHPNGHNNIHPSSLSALAIPSALSISPNALEESILVLDAPKLLVHPTTVNVAPASKGGVDTLSVPVVSSAANHSSYGAFDASATYVNPAIAKAQAYAAAHSHAQYSSSPAAPLLSDSSLASDAGDLSLSLSLDGHPIPPNNSALSSSSSSGGVIVQSSSHQSLDASYSSHHSQPHLPHSPSDPNHMNPSSISEYLNGNANNPNHIAYTYNHSLLQVRQRMIELEQSYAPWLRLHPMCYCAISGIFGSQSLLLAKSVAELFATTMRHARHEDDHDSSGHSEDSNQFVYPLTYVFIVALGICVLGQLHFFASGLEYFDSLYIVPVFKCFFLTLSTVGGMLYFQEFSNFDFLQYLLFPCGLVLNIIGVYVLSSREMIKQTKEKVDEREREKEEKKERSRSGSKKSKSSGSNKSGRSILGSGNGDAYSILHDDDNIHHPYHQHPSANGQSSSSSSGEKKYDSSNGSGYVASASASGSGGDTNAQAAAYAAHHRYLLEQGYTSSNLLRQHSFDPTGSILRQASYDPTAAAAAANAAMTNTSAGSANAASAANSYLLRQASSDDVAGGYYSAAGRDRIPDDISEEDSMDMSLSLSNMPHAQQVRYEQHRAQREAQERERYLANASEALLQSAAEIAGNDQYAASHCSSSSSSKPSSAPSASSHGGKVMLVSTPIDGIVLVASPIMSYNSTPNLHTLTAVSPLQPLSPHSGSINSAASSRASSTTHSASNAIVQQTLTQSGSWVSPESTHQHMNLKQAPLSPSQIPGYHGQQSSVPTAISPNMLPQAATLPDVDPFRGVGGTPGQSIFSPNSTQQPNNFMSHNGVGVSLFSLPTSTMSMSLLQGGGGIDPYSMSAAPTRAASYMSGGGGGTGMSYDALQRAVSEQTASSYHAYSHAATSPTTPYQQQRSLTAASAASHLLSSTPSFSRPPLHHPSATTSSTRRNSLRNLHNNSNNTNLRNRRRNKPMNDILVQHGDLIYRTPGVPDKNGMSYGDFPNTASSSGSSASSSSSYLPRQPKISPSLSDNIASYLQPASSNSSFTVASPLTNKAYSIPRRSSIFEHTRGYLERIGDVLMGNQANANLANTPGGSGGVSIGNYLPPPILPVTSAAAFSSAAAHSAAASSSSASPSIYTAFSSPTSPLSRGYTAPLIRDPTRSNVVAHHPSTNNLANPNSSADARILTLRHAGENEVPTQQVFSALGPRTMERLAAESDMAVAQATQREAASVWLQQPQITTISATEAAIVLPDARSASSNVTPHISSISSASNDHLPSSSSSSSMSTHNLQPPSFQRDDSSDEARGPVTPATTYVPTAFLQQPFDFEAFEQMQAEQKEKEATAAASALAPTATTQSEHDENKQQQ